MRALLKTAEHEVKKRILILDDDEYITQMYKTLLELEDFECTITHCASLAHDLVKSSKYDLIISDIVMPKIKLS